MAKPSWIKLGTTSGSMNGTSTVTASEYTGRTQRGGTITAKTTGGATDTTSVTQSGKAEFINVPTLTYNAAAKGSASDGSDTIQITGTANTANIKVAETTGKIISGASYKIQVNAVNDESWDGSEDTGIDGDPGASAQFTFTIDVKLPENKTTSARVLEIKLQNGNGDVVTSAITINQAAGVKTYGAIALTVGSYSQIPAKGGTASAPSVSFSQPWGWNGVASGGGTITSGGTVSYVAKTGFPTALTLATATGAVTAASRTNVVGAAISGTVTITLTVNGKSASKDVAVSQQANSVSYAVTSVALEKPADIPASGGTVSSAAVTAYGSRTYTSTTVESDVKLVNGSDDCTVAFSDAITASSLGSTITNRTKKGTLTATVTWKTTATKSGSTDVYQAANSATYSEVTFDSAVATTISLKADGTQSRNMTDNSNVGAKQTVTYTSGTVRTEASTVAKVVFSLEPKVKTAATGFALSADGVVSVGANPTTNQRGGFVVTVTATGEGGKSATRDFTFNQQGSASYINITPESMSFTAAGGEKTLTISSNDAWTLE